jgi:hypothetical protein
MRTISAPRMIGATFRKREDLDAVAELLASQQLVLISESLRIASAHHGNKGTNTLWW